MSVPDPVEVAEMVVLDEQIRSALASLPADLDVVIEQADQHIRALMSNASLSQLEAVVAYGARSYMWMGLALGDIRDQRFYRLKFSDFDTYCRERWGMSRTYAHRIIDAARLAFALPIGNRPETESQARALDPIADDLNLAAEVMAAAAEVTDGQPTAEIINLFARSVRDATADTDDALKAEAARVAITESREEIKRAREARVAKRDGHLPAIVDAEQERRATSAASIEVRCGDARVHEAGDLADLAITSPPYPDATGIVYDGDTDAIAFDRWCALLAPTLEQLHDGWQAGRVCLVLPAGIGRTPYRSITGTVWQLLERAGFLGEGEIVWDKATTGNRTTWGSHRQPTEPRIRDRHELIYVARSQHALRIPDDVLVDDGTDRRVSPWLAEPGVFEELTQSVWQLAPESAQRIGHPAPFPTSIPERLLRLYGWPGCRVVDPFAGSGSTGVAALELGANAVLIEQSQDYCDLIAKRITKAAS